MNKFKNILRKIPKTIWVLAGLVVLFKIAIEIPAYPYSFSLLSPDLDNHKILYTDGDVYLKKYTNGESETTLIPGIKGVAGDGLIIGDSSFILTGEREIIFV